MNTTFKLFISIWLVYALYVAPAGGVLPNRYQDLTFSIVNEGRFSIDTYHENTIDKAYYNGHYYTVALPGPAFIAIPAYLVFKPLYAILPENVKQLAGGMQSLKKDALADSSFYGRVDNVEFFLAQMFMTLTTQATLSALGSVFLFKTLTHIGFATRRSVIVTFAYAFGTMVFFFSTVFFEQVLTATMLIGAFYFLLRAQAANTSARAAGWLVLLGGVLTGIGLTIEYASVFAGAVFGAMLLFQRQWRFLFLFGVGLMLPVFGLMAYNTMIFGSPFTTAYRYIDVAQQKNHDEGFFGITYPHVERLWGLLLSIDRGLFVFAPLTLIGLYGLARAVLSNKQRLAVRSSLAIIVLYLLFYASYTDWRGGATFGPRFLIPTLPFLMLGVAMAFDFMRARIIYAVMLLSLAMHWLGAQFGFADSPWQHITRLIEQGPTLPLFGAILSHSTSRASPLYVFAEQYHALLTMGLTVLLIGFLVWWWRELWRTPSEIHG